MKSYEPEVHLSPVDRERSYRKLCEAANDVVAVFAGHQFQSHHQNPLSLVSELLQQGNPSSSEHAIAIANGVINFVRTLGSDYMLGLFTRTMAAKTENKMTQLEQVEQMAVKLRKAQMWAHAVWLIAEIENDDFWNVKSTAMDLVEPRTEWFPGIPRTD